MSVNSKKLLDRINLESGKSLSNVKEELQIKSDRVYSKVNEQIEGYSLLSSKLNYQSKKIGYEGAEEKNDNEYLNRANHNTQDNNDQIKFPNININNNINIITNHLTFEELKNLTNSIKNVKIDEINLKIDQSEFLKTKKTYNLIPIEPEKNNNENFKSTPFHGSVNQNLDFENFENKEIEFHESMIFNKKSFNFYQFSDKPKRYNRLNIDSGKHYFKSRFITEKISSLNGESSLDKISPDDKNVIKFSSLFLQIVEKGIFSFNLKKFEDSYNYLMSSNVIKNEEEFGEILLILHGFDKYIIGDFLSKDKKPLNIGHKMLDYFMNKMCFNQVKFTDGLRFMLSRLNLPKDSSLILAIIDKFTEVYYNDNSNHFQDQDSLYLLCCCTLSLNTTFHRGIEGMKQFSKEDFAKMNNKIDKKLIEEIYDEVQFNKLDIIYEYNELFFKRMYIEGNQIDSQSSRIVHQQENTYSELKNDEIIKMLKKGENFIKYGEYGSPHQRFIKLSDDEKKLKWTPLNSCSMLRRAKYIETIKLKDVYIGSSNSPIFEKYKISLEFDSSCLSIKSQDRTLDLRNDDENIIKKWYQAIKFLIKRIRSISEFQINKNNLKEIINKKEIISDIWSTEILPNWQNYRKFILLKENRNNVEIEKKMKNNQKFHETLVKNFRSNNTEENKFKIINESNKSDVIYLWMLGIPDFLRKKLWPIVIGNQLCITENLFHFYLKKIEKIEFSKYDDNNVKVKKSFVKNGDSEEILNNIIFDINKIYKKFSQIISQHDYDEIKFKHDLFKIVRVFTLSRTDIVYCKQITYISLIFLLNSENYYTGFECLMNFIIGNFSSKFFLKDRNFIKIRYDFFEDLFKKYVPMLYNHFKNLDISISLFFYNWVEYLFTKLFTYNILLRIWDCYIIKGEIFVYEVGITVLKIQEKTLNNTSVKGILKNLKKLPETIHEDEFFDKLQEIDISEQYKLVIEMNNLAYEKTLLYESLL